MEATYLTLILRAALFPPTILRALNRNHCNGKIRVVTSLLYVSDVRVRWEIKMQGMDNGKKDVGNLQNKTMHPESDCYIINSAVITKR
jgi:hypothetical protein